MKQPARALVKVYSWKALLRLIIEDMQRKGYIEEVTDKFYYMSGLDAEGYVYLRVDLTELTRGKSQAGG